MDTVDANLHLGFGPTNATTAWGAQILREIGVSKNTVDDK